MSKVAEVNLKKLRPYGDIMDDGVVQLAFTLPVPVSPESREAAVLLVQKMGYDDIKVATMENAAPGFSFFVIYAKLRHTVDFTQIKVLKVEAKKRSREEIDEIIKNEIGRKLVIVGACTGYDAHTVGIDAIINMKGFAGDYGLERYQWITAKNLGAQVLNDDLLKLAVAEKADAVLVSKVVTQHNIHLKDMKDLMKRAEQLGLTEKMIFVGGGPRVTHPMALECGFDAGFGVGTKPSDVASYIVEEFLRRKARHELAIANRGPESSADTRYEVKRRISRPHSKVRISKKPKRTGIRSKANKNRSRIAGKKAKISSKPKSVKGSR